MATKEQIKLDEQKVISELLKNPTLDTASIAQRCGLSKQKAWRIISNLEKEGGITSRPASLNSKRLGKRSFMVLFQRSFKMVDDRLLDELTLPEMLEEMEAEGINAVVEDSYYLNGAYDWAILITVDEHKDLLKFMELWRKHYGEYFSNVVQSEVMFVTTRNSVLNPRLKEIRDIMR